MTPTQYGAAFVRFWWLILLSVVLGCVLGSVIGGGPTSYTATARVGVLPTPAPQNDANETYLASVRSVQAAAVAKGRMDLYKSLIEDPRVLAKLRTVHFDLDATRLAEQVKVSVVGDTASMFVTATDEDSEVARELATEAGAALAKVITATERDRQGEALLRGAVMGQTTIPRASATPPAWRNPLIGGLGGLALGLGLAIGVSRIDRRVRDRGTQEELLAAPVLAVVPPPRPSGRRAATTAGDRAVDSLRTSIYFARDQHDRALRIALVPVGGLTGVGELAQTLSEALADTGARVLLVDADLATAGDGGRAVSTDDGHRSLAPGGLAELLAGDGNDRGIIDVGREDPAGPALDVLPLGDAQAMSEDLLHARTMQVFLDRVSGDYDFIVFAATRIDAGTGALAVAARSDVTVLAARKGRTRRDDLVDAKAELDQINARLLGSVVVG